MSGKKFFVYNEQEKTFDYIILITHAYYADRILIIEYNPFLKKHLLEVDENFTPYNYDDMMSFKSKHSFRLYEILRAEIYLSNGKVSPKNGEFKISYQLAKFKFLMGLVHPDQELMTYIFPKKIKIDYDKAIRISKNREYERWNDLKYWVIDKAIKEIEEKTSMKILYDTLKSGKGNKVYQINFNIKLQ